MSRRRVWLLGFALAACLCAPARAAEQIEISHLHLCCPGCVSAVEEALEEVEGVSALQVDREQQSATFKVDSAAQRDKALTSLMAAGFGGEVTVDGEALELPCESIDAETSADQIVFAEVHLCCKGCAKGVARAFEKIDEVVSVDCDLKSGTVTLTGKGLHVSQMRTALHRGGFHGEWKRR